MRKIECFSIPCLVATLHRFFMDLRLISGLMCVWLCIVLFIMVEIGVFANSSFVAFGPRPELSFMRVSIDTYYKYNMLIIMIVMHTFITDFIADSLSPHVVNVIQDPKTTFIPHKPFTYYAITTIWAVYCSISQLFAIFIAFAQLDLLLVRMVTDILANLVTTTLYLRGKTYNVEKFKLAMDNGGGHSHSNNNNNMMIPFFRNSITKEDNNNNKSCLLEEHSVASSQDYDEQFQLLTDDKNKSKIVNIQKCKDQIASEEGTFTIE